MTDHPALDAHPVVHTHEVEWGDMDALGHVNNAVYFRYFETARIKFFEEINMAGLRFEGSVGPILANISSNFRRPVEYPDTIHVGTRVSELGTKRFNMEYSLVSETLDEVAAQGECVVVAYDFDRDEAVAVPEGLIQRIEDLQGVEFDS